MFLVLAYLNVATMCVGTTVTCKPLALNLYTMVVVFTPTSAFKGLLCTYTFLLKHRHASQGMLHVKLAKRYPSTPPNQLPSLLHAIYAHWMCVGCCIARSICAHWMCVLGVSCRGAQRPGLSSESTQRSGWARRVSDQQVGAKVLCQLGYSAGVHY